MSPEQIRELFEASHSIGFAQGVGSLCAAIFLMRCFEFLFWRIVDRYEDQKV